MSEQYQHVAHHHFVRLLVLAMGAFGALIMTTTAIRTSLETTPAKLAACIPLTLADSVARADLVLTGDVFLVVPAEPGYASVLITPQKVLKGKVPSQGVRILAIADAGAAGSRSDDLHFTSNQPPYLLFLQQQPDGVYRTSKCVGSRLLGGGLTVEELAAFGA